MSSDIMFPDYNKSILNLITSILKYYGVKSEYNSLPILDKYLEKGYKNVVFIVMDGMGQSIVKGNIPNGIIDKNTVEKITSVYPSTTAAAMTTYYSGKPPIETGWVAWSQYFKEFGRNIEVLRNTDSYTGEVIKSNDISVFDILKYKNVSNIIQETTNGKIKVWEITPKYIVFNRPTSAIIGVDGVESMCNSIETLCKNPEKKCIFAYIDNPDSIIHEYGCYSNETREYMNMFEKNIAKLAKSLEGTDTLIVISADHGHIDINESYNILDFEDIQECLVMPPSFESRMLTFFVKESKKDVFKEIFNSHFKDKFLIYSKKEFLESKLMGYGNAHKKIDDFVGDFVAIAISDVLINIKTHISRQKPEKKATHCGLTKNEMEVPLVVLDLK